MKIRESIPEDSEQVKALAEKHKINLPSDGKIIVAESTGGKIEGFSIIRPIFYIEPFICENPLIGLRLWNYIKDKSEKGGISILRCFAQQKHLKLFKKLGFYRVFKKATPLEINFLRKEL